MRTVVSIALAAIALVVTAAPVRADDPVGVGDLRIVQTWARASASHGMAGAAYMTIANTGDKDDRLVAVATAVAKKAEIHETNMDGDIMKMRMLKGGLPIPAGGAVEMKPMGVHVMMQGITKKLVEGETLMLTLTFEQAGSVDVAVPVAGPGAMAAPHLH